MESLILMIESKLFWKFEILMFRRTPITSIEHLVFHSLAMIKDR